MTNTIPYITTDYRLSKVEASRKAKSRWAKCKRKCKKKYGVICTRCKASVYIEYHHLNDRSHYPKQAYTIKNIRPLCKFCHRIDSDSIHSTLGGTRKIATKEAFFTWISASKVENVLLDS